MSKQEMTWDFVVSRERLYRAAAWGILGLGTALGLGVAASGQFDAVSKKDKEIQTHFAGREWDNYTEPARAPSAALERARDAREIHQAAALALAVGSVVAAGTGVYRGGRQFITEVPFYGFVGYTEATRPQPLTDESVAVSIEVNPGGTPPLRPASPEATPQPADRPDLY